MSNFARDIASNEFDLSRVVGKTLAEVAADTNIEWADAYPTVDPETMLVTGVVNGSYPEEFNGGNWKIVDDSYVVATDGGEEG